MFKRFNPNFFKAMGPLHLAATCFALVRYGGGIQQVSGSIGGDVHAHNRFGHYIRPRTIPVNPHSVRQEGVRADLSYLAEYWHGDLTIAQRAAWKVYADAVVMQNRIGESIHLTGYNHFIRSSMAVRNYYAGQAAAAPVILSLPDKDPTLICTEEDVAAQTFTFTFDNADWAPDGETKMRMFIYQGLPQLASRNFFAGPWRLMDPIATTEGEAGTDTLDAVFPFGVGQKVFFKARILTVSYRFTEPWYTDPRIIEADA